METIGEKYREQRKKVLAILDHAIFKERGGSVRGLMRRIAREFDDSPEDLRRFFNDSHPYIAGIASSAYHFLTGDISVIQGSSYGGLGAIIRDSPYGLFFDRNQLSFARITGDALMYSTNSGNSLWHSKNSGFSLRCSKNSGNSLWHSKNSGHALRGSTNSENSLWHSKNSGHALRGSKNSGFSFIWIHDHSSA